jgi:signal transduction histidine kinase
MSSTFPSGLGRTFSFRLTVSISIAFILSSLIIFGFAYLRISSSLQANDKTVVQLKLREYAEEYEEHKLDGIRTRVDSDASSGAVRSFVVRVAGPQNQTLFLKRPEDGVNYDFNRLERTIAEPGSWIHLKATDKEDVLDIASKRLTDQLLLQVGKDPEDREAVLKQFQNAFVAVLAAVIALSIVLGTVLARQALRPVRGLINELGPIIDTGQTEVRIPVRQTGDEFEELAIRFNQALEKIDGLIEGMRASLDNVAHDLRTPMTRLRGVAEMALQSEPNTESFREALSDCLEESSHVLQLLNMLMDISEVEAGSVRLDRQEVSVLELMNYVHELYRYIAEDKNIVVRIQCADELSVRGDRNRLLQVMANLLDNAIKYNRDGGTVELAAARVGDQVVINVTDSGIGIAPEDLMNIWDRFYRGDKSRAQRGLGLGLSLVRAVVQAHQGKIEVFSEQSSGSRFVISLEGADRNASESMPPAFHLSKM